MRKMKWSGEIVVNLFLFLISAFYLTYSLIHYNVGTVRLPKEGFMPALAGAGGTLVSAFLLVQALMGKGDARNVKLNIPWVRFFLLVGVSLVYAFTMSYLGYSLGTFLFLFSIFKIAQLDGIVKPLLISAISAGAFYAIFKLALGVMLPGGFLGF